MNKHMLKKIIIIYLYFCKILISNLALESALRNYRKINWNYLERSNLFVNVNLFISGSSLMIVY